MSIAAVERDCGIAKDTLRVWERRYGFPKPQRDRHDERVYSAGQVATLRLLRRLVEAGHRPGKVVGRSHAELTALLEQVADPSDGAIHPHAREVLERLAGYDAVGLQKALDAMMAQAGLGGFAAEIAPGLAEAVGAAWARGDLEIHQEHLFTEQLTTVLRSAVNAARGAGLPREHPRVLFSTFPQEPHALGLLMAEAVFALEGCVGMSLGAQTPVPEIAAAARAHRADIVALSFSSMMPIPQAIAGLDALRGQVPEAIEIWIGGAGAPRRTRPGVSVLRDLAAISAAVGAWRARHAVS